MAQPADNEKADIYICVFPHLSELLVIDTRPQPDVRLFQAGEVLTEEFFREVEEEFSRLLRERGDPFLNLMSLPQRLENLLQEKSLASVLSGFRPSGGEPLRVSILLGGGPMLSLPEPALTETVRHLLGPEASEETVSLCLSHLSDLISREQTHVQQAERESLRETIRGQSPYFFTLWERQG